MAYDTANCYVCSKKLKPEDIKYFKEAILELLDVIFTAESIKNLTEITNPVICKSCSDKIYDSFNFKSKCIDNEDMLVPYIKELGPKLNLKDVCCKEGLFREKDLSDNITICRLCLNINSEKKHLDKALNKNELHDVIENNFSEINVKLLKESYICEKCIENLKKYKCLIEIFSKTIKKTTQPSEGVKEDREKSSESSQDLEKNKDGGPKKDGRQNEKHKMYKCTECKYTTERKAGLKQHSDTHKKTSKYYKCDKCDFKSKYERSCQLHMKTVHSEPLFKCPECPKALKTAASCRRHIKMVHSEGIQMYTCDQCDFKTKSPDYLRRHSLVHKIDHEITWHNCQKCSYRSKTLVKLRRHMLQHSDAPPKYKCPQCDYRTHFKENLKKHTPKHDDNAVTYSCDQCSYVTKHKSYLKYHKALHADPNKVRKYKCKLCSYETIHKGNIIKQHMLTHKVEEGEMYKCDKCDFKTAYKQHFLNHDKVHKDFGEVEAFYCYVCSFKTKHKSSLALHINNHLKNGDIGSAKR